MDIIHSLHQVMLEGYLRLRGKEKVMVYMKVICIDEMNGMYMR